MGKFVAVVVLASWRWAVHLMVIGPCHQSWSQVIGRRLISSFLFGCIVKPYPNLIIFLTLFYVYFILRATRAGQNLRWVGDPFLIQDTILIWSERGAGGGSGASVLARHPVCLANPIQKHDVCFVSTLPNQNSADCKCLLQLMHCSCGQWDARNRTFINSQFTKE